MLVLRVMLVGVVATVAAAAAAGAVGAQAVAPKDGGDPIAGAQVFQRCAGCHSAVSGAPPKLGPGLYGVVGRKAGSMPGYQYSTAMRASGQTWTKASLDAFLTAPRTAVPGNKMPFMGLSNAQDRANVIAYLAGTKAAAKK